MNGDKYRIEKEQVSYDGGVTWTDTGNTRRGELIEVDSTDCLQYRWIEVQNDYICVGGDKYSKEKQQSSNDDGVTWTDTGVQRTGEIIESGSNDCNFASNYFTIEALEDIRIYLNSEDVNYSRDNGQTWTRLQFGNHINMTNGEKVLWKSYWYNENGRFESVKIGNLSESGRCNVYGNVMSLLYGDDFEGVTTMEGKPHLSGLFTPLYFNGLGVVSAENLLLPATTLAERCYYHMFRGCTKLVTAPAILPATTLAKNCYQGMFGGCTSLKNIPQLPATTLAEGCYNSMFSGCTSLTIAPQLPVMTLAEYCYGGMFWGCTSLTTAPLLPATTLANWCYHNMFRECTSLTTAPELPATTLAEYCYQGMFLSCTSLTTAPELPATTLVSHCYYVMFTDCTSLSYVKAMFTSRPTPSGYEGWTGYWLRNVSPNGTFVKNSEATWTDRGSSSIPKNWSIQLA